MDVSSLIGGLGIGSVLTLFLKEYFDQRKILSKRAFDEKRDANVSYLDIAARSQMMPEAEAIWARTSAIERIRLCGSARVVELLNIVSNTSPDSPRDNVNALVKAMREDLFPKSK